MPGNNLPRSLSPVHITGEELTAAVRRSRRRQGLLEKQESKEQGEEEGEQVRWEDQGALERVRFDDKVSFIEALHSPPGAHGTLKQRKNLLGNLVTSLCKAGPTLKSIRTLKISLAQVYIT